jgi:anti-sigma factor RsiW
MSPPDEPDESDLLLGAYLDGELDALAARRFEARLAAEPALAADYARLRSLRALLRIETEGDAPSQALRTRIAAQIAPAASRRIRLRAWSALAASLLVGAVVGGSATFGVLQHRQGENATDQFVAAHIRALMAPQPADVASTDRHTVKPWFDGKLAFAPDVVDLAAQGFPLVGGRIDVVNLEPAPVLVYGAGRHLISLTEVPDGSAASQVTTTAARGYEVLAWSDGKVRYFAVSDASDEEMRNFVGAVRAMIGP